MTTTALPFPHLAHSHEVRLTDVTALPAADTTNRRLHILFRTVVFAIAAGFALTGFALLTSLLALPFTLVMWFCAATTMGLGVMADHAAARGRQPAGPAD
jgi:hypothetical protein